MLRLKGFIVPAYVHCVCLNTCNIIPTRRMMQILEYLHDKTSSLTPPNCKVKQNFYKRACTLPHSCPTHGRPLSHPPHQAFSLYTAFPLGPRRALHPNQRLSGFIHLWRIAPALGASPDTQTACLPSTAGSPFAPHSVRLISHYLIPTYCIK